MPDSPRDTAADAGLARLNALPAAEVDRALAACLDVDGWVADLRAARPYPSRAELLRVADERARRLTDTEVAGALARHPRIGERAAGGDTEAAWSRGEQSGVDRDDRDTAEALRAGNVAYERRFGHIYLVCASGRSGAELLADLTARLDNDPATEARVVAGELRRIALLRVEKLLAELAAETASGGDAGSGTGTEAPVAS